MLVTPSGIFTEVKLLQFSKAPQPILVTPSGIFTEVKLLQCEYLEVIDSQLFAVNTVEK